MIIIIVLGVLLVLVILFLFCSLRISSQISREEEYIEKIFNTNTRS